MTHLRRRNTKIIIFSNKLLKQEAKLHKPTRKLYPLRMFLWVMKKIQLKIYSRTLT